MSVFDPTFFSNKRIVDLSQPISVDMQTFPGDPSTRIEVLSTIDTGGANTTRIVLSAHAGTHVDVPHHLIESGKAVDELPLEAFCGSALTYDLSHKAEGSRICPDDLEVSTPLPYGDIALFYTGSNDSTINGLARGSCTHLDRATADLLIEKRVKAVGIDSMSVDSLDSSECEVHKKLLQNDIVIFENLSNNLRLLVGRQVLFFGMPLKLVHGDASPVRAFALCEEDSNSYLAQNVGH
ncbi:MAG: cyclase family protein [Euryarchaeota archaeon]|nr:cyclase family protein [Euryarchaeota archaeon]